jgi:TetR/AcrR family transcriptional regulator
VISERRLGSPEAKNRQVLLDAAEQLMLAEGYAAVTARRVAAQAGLKYQLVHYYFRTMNDLFLALFRRRAEEGLDRQAKALASSQPLWALWEFSTDPAGTRITMEFMGLANRDETFKAEIARYGELLRAGQLEALPAILEGYGVAAQAYPPEVLAVLLTGVSRVLVMERELGLSLGHAQTRELVEQYLRQLEGEWRPTGD